MAKNKHGGFLQGLLVPLVVIALWEGASRAGW
ncbi:MAG: ABC transporter permease, partial [Paucibacter sp.]|nr:ABC transporter permease [Roseateles sp.]